MVAITGRCATEMIFLVKSVCVVNMRVLEDVRQNKLADVFFHYYLLF